MPSRAAMHHTLMSASLWPKLTISNQPLQWRPPSARPDPGTSKTPSRSVSHGQHVACYSFELGIAAIERSRGHRDVPRRRYIARTNCRDLINELSPWRTVEPVSPQRGMTNPSCSTAFRAKNKSSHFQWL